MMRNRLLKAAVVLSVGVLAITGCTNKNDAGAGTDDGGKTTVAFVPKLQGIPYFEAMNEGGKQAAGELGIEWLYQGPTTADAAAQADIVRSFIQQRVDTLIVAPNDPDSMAPLLKQAQDAGIRVATADTDAPNSVREVFVNQTTEENHGRALSETLMKAMDGSGDFAIVSCSETAANLNAYIDVIKQDVKENYKDAKLVDLVYAGEDQAKAAAMATDLMNAHPNLKGIVGLCSAAAPGVAQAVKDAGKTGDVFTVGGGTPMAMAPYLKDGSASASVLWDVQNLGYLTAWTGSELAEDKTLQAKFDVNEKIKGVTYDATSKVELLGPPLVFTKENVDQFKY